MYIRTVGIGISILVATAGLPKVRAGESEGAAGTYAQGVEQLTQGDFDTALKLFSQAARADSENREYSQQYAMVRRVVKMRKSIASEKNPEKWRAKAQALRAFYFEQSIYKEALALDGEDHARTNSGDSASRLAETQLMLGMNAEAAALLSGLSEDESTLAARLLLGIALARNGDIASSRTTAAQCTLPPDAGPGMLFDLARLRALLGDTAEALDLLTRCFEATPPSRLAAFKDYSKESKDLGALVASAGFAKVLKTESKVKESSCSSGTGCGKCPSRGGCSTKGAKHPPKKKP
ncbi:MAG: tetratricopeptide repeat protein [bacterium]|nr:tetratricopeptide repeat protein [bacterium]